MRMPISKTNILTIVVLAFFSIMPHVASAIPALQLYVDGATYDTGSETWVLTNSGDFTLWVLGDVGHYGNIYGVKLTAAVSTSELGGGSISLTPTTATGTGFFDPSTPSTPGYIGISTDGAVPTMGDGSDLATHGIYGSGTSFYEWSLGNFTLKDSKIGDFITSYPTTFPDKGQINAYTVTASGFSTIHFDAFDHICADNHVKYKFAPFSHDAETNNKVPEPSTLLLFGSGLLGLGLFGRKRFGK